MRKSATAVSVGPCGGNVWLRPAGEVQSLLVHLLLVLPAGRHPSGAVCAPHAF